MSSPLRRRMALWAPGVVLVAGAAVLWWSRDRLPDPVAIHWDLRGRADGFAHPGDLALLLLLVGVPVWAVGVGAALLGRRSPIARGLLAFPSAVVSFVVALFLVSAIPQMAQMGGEGDLGPLAALVPLVDAAVGGALGWWLAGPAPARPRRSHVPAPDDIGTVEATTPTGRVPLVLGVLLIGASTVAIVLGSIGGGPVLAFVGTVLAAIGALLFSSSRFELSTDGSAAPPRVVIRGRLGIPRISLRLDEIADVEAGTVSAWEFGGLGVRVGADDSTAVITRSGPAVVITLTDGARILVSMDDPDLVVAGLRRLLRGPAGGLDGSLGRGGERTT